MGQADLGDNGHRLLLAPLWLLGSLLFWIGTPWFLLHKKVGLRALFPGALLGAVVLGGAAAFAPLFLPATLVANGKTFGSFGVALTLVGWMFILLVLSLVCAVFGPVWREWRALERERPPRRRPPPTPPDAGFTPSGRWWRARLRCNRGSGRPHRSSHPPKRRTIMCRWLAYSGKPVRIEELLYRPQHSLVVQSLSSTMGAEPTNGDGFGIGWYGVGDEPGGLPQHRAGLERPQPARALAAHRVAPRLLARPGLDREPRAADELPPVPVQELAVHAQRRDPGLRRR